MADANDVAPTVRTVTAKGVELTVCFCFDGTLALGYGRPIPVPAVDADLYVVLSAGELVDVLPREAIEDTITRGLSAHNVVLKVQKP